MKKVISAFCLAVLSVFALQGCTGSVPAKASPDDPAGNFFQVSEGLYRGGRPDEAGVQRLAQMGVKTIINLENDDQAVATERGWAEPLGIKFVNAPMDGMKTPDDNQVNQVEAMLGDKSQGPFYVHCLKGMDRTGAIIAIDRVVNEGWLPKDAYDEMNAMGFNSLLLFLKDYVRDKIGLDH
jgi:protein tyrosine/serine phosphatase